MFTQKDFEIDVVLNKPLMAHLSSLDDGEPRDSPVWFLWEPPDIWLFGQEKDSFVQRLHRESRCALGVVDFDLEGGILHHVGVRGTAHIHSCDRQRLYRMIAKYLSPNDSSWNSWFVANIVDPINAMVQVTPRTIVANNGSFFKMGPKCASPDDE